MATLSSFKEIQNSNLLRLVITEGEENAAYTVRTRIYNEIGMPTRGSQINDGAMELILREDEYVRCKKRALYLLSIADNNEKNLFQKLRAKGFCSEISGEVCREMVSLGYINEDSQIERIVLREANGKLFGPRKIVANLAGKGYSLSKIKDAISTLSDNGEIDFQKNASLLLSRKLDEDASEEERLAVLIKYGYKR